jgi:RNA polymerase sigma-70 factor, ECF subfamily
VLAAASMTHASIDHETAIRDACSAGQLEAGATATLEAYGPEILSFLIVRLRSASDAQDVFSMFAEDLWTGLAKFGWRCSMRTWAYALARNAATRYASTPQRRAGRNVPLSSASQLSDAVERVRSATNLFQQTAVKDRFRSLRDRLDSEDQMLLVLRVDRGMAWRDLAIAMAGDAELDDKIIERESLRLRKAFERVKSELKRIAEREGLLKPRD